MIYFCIFVMGILIVLLSGIILYQLNDYRFSRKVLRNLLFLIISLLGIACFLFSFKNSKYLGDPGTWFGSLFTAGALIFAYQQIEESRIQSDQNLTEMRKEREETYHPELYVKEKRIWFNLKSFKNEIDSRHYSIISRPYFRVYNIGMNTAKAVTIKYGLIKDKKFDNYLDANNIIHFENNKNIVILNRKINYSFEKTDKVQEKNLFLLSGKSFKVYIPIVYLNVLRWYIDNENVLKNKTRILEADLSKKIPSFSLKIEINYLSLEGKELHKNFLINIKFLEAIREDKDNKYYFTFVPHNVSF